MDCRVSQMDSPSFKDILRYCRQLSASPSGCFSFGQAAFIRNGSITPRFIRGSLFSSDRNVYCIFEVTTMRCVGVFTTILPDYLDASRELITSIMLEERGGLLSDDCRTEGQSFDSALPHVSFLCQSDGSEADSHLKRLGFTPLVSMPSTNGGCGYSLLGITLQRIGESHDE